MQSVFYFACKITKAVGRWQTYTMQVTGMPKAFHAWGAIYCRISSVKNSLKAADSNYSDFYQKMILIFPFYYYTSYANYTSTDWV